MVAADHRGRRDLLQTIDISSVERVIRTEDHFVWNSTILVAFLGIGFSVGFILGLTQPSTLFGSFGRIFVHLGGGHILGNLAGIFLIGLVIAVFAHPVEFVVVLASTVLVNTLINLSIPAAGLSLVLFALVGATVLFLLGSIFEVKQFDHFGSRLLVLGSAFVLLLVVGARYQGQLLHDAGVVLLDQPVRMDTPGYTRESSLGHLLGFAWGCLAAVGSRLLRYRIVPYDLAGG